MGKTVIILSVELGGEEGGGPMLRHIPLGQMNNLRDLGGYLGADGRVTVWERFLRGDTPLGLKDRDIQWLLDRDITTIIDLRTPAEVLRKPDQLSTIPGFHYVNCPLLEGEAMPNLANDVARGYFDLVEGKTMVRTAMAEMAAAPGGVLFHCTAGKDRTGLLSALLLGLAGVSRADILADYQVSETYLADIIQRIKRVVPDLAPFAGASRSDYLGGCLDLLEEAYGSVAGYLLGAGLTAGELETLQRKLLATV